MSLKFGNESPLHPPENVPGSMPGADFDKRPATAAQGIIRFQDVTLGYGRRAVLEGLSFEIRRGEFLGIIGPNGAGKTTVLRAILGLLRPLAGEVRRTQGQRYGYVMQRQFLDTLFPFRAAEIVRMGRFGRRRPWQRMSPEDRRAVADALRITDLSDISDHLYRELSGGQRQRVLIARALASEPEVLILDEPTNDMDIRGESRIMGLLREIQTNLGVTVILVSHLLHVLLNVAERFVFLAEGRAHVHALAELLEGDLLSGIYGVPVTVGETGGRRYLITGG